MMAFDSLFFYRSESPGWLLLESADCVWLSQHGMVQWLPVSTHIPWLDGIISLAPVSAGGFWSPLPLLREATSAQCERSDSRGKPHPAQVPFL